MLGPGALWFGIVIGFITYRTLRRTETNGIPDIAAVIGAVGGGSVVTLFPAGGQSFDAYAFGLAIGFFAYLVLSLFIEGIVGRGAGKEFLGDK